MIIFYKILAVCSTLFVFISCATRREDTTKVHEKVTSYSMPISHEGLTRMTENWPQVSKSAIKNLDAKYGLPSSITEDMVVWNNTPPFKRSIVYREEVLQQFPQTHSDVLQQFIDYKVPMDKIDEVSKFDGSILIDRTKGEISTRNDQEEMNILVFNLTDKIVRGEMTPEEARREYSKNAESFSSGTMNKMVSELNFKPKRNTSDPDVMMQSQEAPTETMKKKKIESNEVYEIIEEEE